MARKEEVHGRDVIQYRDGKKVILTKLDSLEEYEEKAAELDEYAAMYVALLQNNSTVYTVSEQDLRLYGDGWLDVCRVGPNVAYIVQRLKYGIKETHQLDPATLPVIPIMEYKLVPTGNIYYYDPALPPEEEKHRRDLWKMRQYYIKVERGKRQAKRKQLEAKRKQGGDPDDGV